MIHVAERAPAAAVEPARTRIAVLAGPGPLTALFQQRFAGEGGLAGHTVGMPPGGERD